MMTKTRRKQQFEEAIRAALESSGVVADVGEATEWVVNTLADWGLMEEKPAPKPRGGLLERSWNTRQKQIILNLHHGNGIIDSHPATLQFLKKMGVISVDYTTHLTPKGKALATFLEGK